jgi:aflatoxin B1 aldehyde reductase
VRIDSTKPPMILNHSSSPYHSYWNDHYFKAMDIIRPLAENHGLTLAEVALRWVSHHSKMKREYGDSVIIGASSLTHIEQVS